MIRLYSGFDPREEVGYHTFCSSVIHNTTEPVTFCPLHADMLKPFYDEGQRDGTNSFIYTRFLIPYLQKFEGWALFVDGADMLARVDLAKLWALRNPYKAVQIVKHDYKTQHPRKYVGTQMESANADYPRKNWSSVMLINCSHYAWRDLTPEFVAKMPGSYLHRFEFIADKYIGELPAEWNWIADEYGTNPEAKLLHWTAGIPGFPHYAQAPHAPEWFDASRRVTHAIG